MWNATLAQPQSLDRPLARGQADGEGLMGLSSAPRLAPLAQLQTQRGADALFAAPPQFADWPAGPPPQDRRPVGGGPLPAFQPALIQRRQPVRPWAETRSQPHTESPLAKAFFGEPNRRWLRAEARAQVSARRAGQPIVPHVFDDAHLLRLMDNCFLQRWDFAPADVAAAVRQLNVAVLREWVPHLYTACQAHARYLADLHAPVRLLALPKQVDRERPDCRRLHDVSAFIGFT